MTAPPLPMMLCLARRLKKRDLQINNLQHFSISKVWQAADLSWRSPSAGPENEYLDSVGDRAIRGTP
jgi:hypothetical protein